MIRFGNADLGYGKKAVLTGVSCDIQPGNFIGLAGPNGSGKTTFLRTVLGLLPPLNGTLEIERNHRFAYVPQADDLNLLWPLTVEEVVKLALRGRRAFGRLTREEVQAADEAIEKTGIARLRDRRLSELSGGQRQRAVLASALAQNPTALLLDEPTRGLDIRVESDFMNLVASLWSRNTLTVLLVTHTLQIPLNYAQKIFLFSEGKVIVATPDELTHTNRLESIYGLPIIHGAHQGVRWVAAAPEKKP